MRMFSTVKRHSFCTRRASDACDEGFIDLRGQRALWLEKGICQIRSGIEALDKSVAEATETRKAENAEYTTVAAQNNAAVQLLGVAENRLNKSTAALHGLFSYDFINPTPKMQVFAG